MDNSAKSVEKVDKAVDNSKNAEDIIKKIVNEPRLRPNLLEQLFIFKRVLWLLFRRKALHKYLTNTDNLFRQIAGCEVKVLKYGRN